MTAHPEDATLLALLAGDLSTADAERLSAHLSDCPRCQGARQGFEAALERLHQSGAEPSPFVVARLERTIFSRLAGTSPRPKLVPRRTAATAALMAGLSGAALAPGALRVFVDPRPDAAAAPIESLAPRQPPLRAAIAMPTLLPEVTSASDP
ncbi:MAG: anti-sigma factor family protein, partial [Myxococcota bacterium]